MADLYTKNAMHCKTWGGVYNGIDLFKFIMAIFVVAIHTQPLINCTNRILLKIYSSIVSCAVPYFFLSSGFLLAKKMSDGFDKESDLKCITLFIRKNVKLYVLWTLLYMPLTFYGYVVSGDSFVFCVAHFFRGLFLTGTHYNSHMLWYLLATIYAGLAIRKLLINRYSILRIVAVGAVLFVVATIMDSFMEYDAESIRSVQLLIKALFGGRGRLLAGLFYISLGMLLAKKKVKILYGLLLSFTGFIFVMITQGIYNGLIN